MSAADSKPPSAAALAFVLAKRAIFSLHEHWALACFSLVAAFGVWFVIQDVENPRVQGSIPGEGEPAAVEVVAKNAGDYIVRDLAPVRVQVDSRKDDVATLRATDFEAFVDVQGIQPGSAPVELPVRATSRRDGVRVIGVTPSTMRVTVVAAATKEVKVAIRRTGELPSGYRETPNSDPTIEPAFVTVRGLPELVASVTTADVVVNLSGARGETLTVEGDLTPRSESGGEVTVKLSQPRARVTIKIEQTFVQRTMAVTPSVAGAPLAGYRVTNVSVDPPTVIVNGPKAVVDSITLGLGTERVDISGAKSDVVLTRSIEQPPNTALDRRSVTVKVEIRPIECSAGTGTPCGATTFFVAPDIGAPPIGLVRDTGAAISVEVRVSGPLAVVSALKPADIKAAVSLAMGTAGTANYPVTIAPITGVRIEPVDPVPVTLKPVMP